MGYLDGVARLSLFGEMREWKAAGKLAPSALFFYCLKLVRPWEYSVPALMSRMERGGAREGNGIKSQNILSLRLALEIVVHRGFPGGELTSVLSDAAVDVKGK